MSMIAGTARSMGIEVVCSEGQSSGINGAVSGACRSNGRGVPATSSSACSRSCARRPDWRGGCVPRGSVTTMASSASSAAASSCRRARLCRSLVRCRRRRGWLRLPCPRGGRGVSWSSPTGAQREDAPAPPLRARRCSRSPKSDVVSKYRRRSSRRSGQGEAEGVGRRAGGIIVKT